MIRCRLPLWTLLALFLPFFPCLLGAEPVITIESPILKDGMAGVQEMLNQSIADFTGNIDGLVGDTLDKPRFMKGAALACSQAVLITSCIRNQSYPYISLGSTASYYSPGLSGAIVSEMDSLDMTSDLNAGACIQPLVVRGGIPADFLLRGLSFDADVGYMKAETGSFGIWSASGGVSATYAIYPPKKGLVSWDGLSVSAGGNFAINRLSVTIETGEITEVIPIDPDGVGPLSPFDATVAVDPEIRAGIETTLISGHLGASTGMTLFRALSLFAGAGVSAGWSKSAISIDGEDDIDVSGYLGKLIESPGKIRISGTTDEQRSLILSGYMSGGVAFHVGAFDLSIPVAIRPFDSFGAGVFFGVRL